MPRFDYRCDRGHVTERVTPLSGSPGPEKIRCKFHMSMTHSPGCREWHTCGAWARRQMPVVGVSGDLPTRGSF